VSDVATYPVFPHALPGTVSETKHFEVRFANTEEELHLVQQLRFEIFNVELGEGLDSSFETGRDADRFDVVNHHLIVVDKRDDRIIGTYRMQTDEMAREYEGYYSSGEFDLGGLPDEVRTRSIEIGRAAVHIDYRNRQVLFLLWKGLAAYMLHNDKSSLFGCCSLTSQEPSEGYRVMQYLEQNGFVHDAYRVDPQSGWECYGSDFTVSETWSDRAVDLPKLFRLYLRYGAKVCGPPALDREFKTIDYLVLLSTDDIDDDTRRMYFQHDS